MIKNIYDAMFNSGKPTFYWFGTITSILSFLLFMFGLSFGAKAFVDSSQDNVKPELVGTMGEDSSVKIYHMRTNLLHDCYVIQYNTGYGISCFK